MIEQSQLAKSKGTAIPRYLCFFDCEASRHKLLNQSWGEFQTLRFGVARFGRYESGKFTRVKELVFYTSAQFWEWFFAKLNPRYTVWLMAHNIGYDLTVAGFWEYLENGTVKFSSPRSGRNRPRTAGHPDTSGWKLVCFNDPPTIVCFEHTCGGRFVAVDTLNYWRTSLANLGKQTGFDKLGFPDWNAPESTWLAYCKQDVAVIENAVIKLMEWFLDNDYGNFAYTTPGLAMAAFRHKFYDHGINFHREWEVRKLERAAYFGGQTEAYRVGNVEEELHQYDVNSLYPSVMLGSVFPVSLVRYDLSSFWRDKQPQFRASHSVCEVLLTTATATYPVRVHGNPMYATGTYATVLCGPELVRAIDNGHVKRFGRWATYICKPIFNSYVSHFWSLRRHYREEGNLLGITFVKLMLNSLYGKFGQRGADWELNEDEIAAKPYGKWDRLDRTTGTRRDFFNIGHKVFEKCVLPEHRKASPAIAGFVTAYARESMRLLRSIARRSNVYYQATDSLLVNCGGKLQLESAGVLSSTELGGLKFEHSGKGAYIGGLNHYYIGQKIVEGGKKANAINLHDGAWQETQFQSLRSVLDGNTRHGVKVREVVKRRSGIYTKGDVQESGWVTPHCYDTTTPVNLQEY